MLSFKAPIYKIYFYSVIIFFTTAVLASSKVIDSAVFENFLKNKIPTYEQNETAGTKEFKAFFVPPYSSDSTEHVAFTQTCFAPGGNDSTQFYAVTDESEYVRFSWNFGTGDPADTSNQKNPYFFFQTPGEYNITATFYKANGEAVVIDTVVNVDGDIAPPNLLPDTAICPDQFPFALKAYVDGQNPAGAKYIWSTGDTTDEFSAKTPGNYWVAVTVGSCTKVEEIEVTEYGKARERAAVWYFGEGAGIDFNEGAPTAIDSAKLLNAPAGAAAISDIDGNILFYTNGSTIYNRDHEVMSGGKNIGGDSTSTQSSIIVPWPSRVPYYFVFTTEDNGSAKKTLSVTLVDMKGDSANGKVIYKNNFVYEPVSEKLTAYALKNAQDTDSLYWLVTQDANTGAFLVFKIDSSGISQPPQSFDFGTPAVTEGQMKISSTGDYIAVAAGDKVHLYNFNDTTGAITDSVTIDLGGSGAYGVEFSPDGNKLYVSNSDGIYQIDIGDSTGTRMPNDSILLPKHKFLIASGSNYGSLQLGPDNRIYVAVDGATSLAVISNPTAEDGDVGFLPTGFALSPGTRSTKGLPNFVQSFLEPPQGPGIGHQDACGPGPISFFASGWGDRDDFSWNVTNASGTSVFSQSGRMLTMIEPNLQLGNHTATVRITNDCGMDTTLTDEVIVIGSPAPIELGGPYTLCPGGSQALDAGAIQQDEQYIWSTGETTRTIAVTQPGAYTVIVLKSNGCSEVDQAIVSPPSFGDIIGDTVLCQGDISRLSSSSTSPTFTYTWYRNGIVQSNSSFLNVNSSGLYALVVVNTAGCKDSSAVNVTVSPLPVVTPQIARQPTCNDRNGRIVLTNPAESGYRYRWADQRNNIIAGDTTQTLDHVGPGVYRAYVTHPQGCETVYTIALNPSGATLSANSGVVDCGTNGLNITVNISSAGSPLAPPFKLEMIRQDNNQTYFSAPSQNASNWMINSVPEGDYLVTVRDNNNCLYSLTDIRVNPSPLKPVVDDLGPPITVCENTEVRAISSSAYTYSWVSYRTNWTPTPAPAFTPITANNDRILVSKPAGSSLNPETIYYVLTADNAGCIKRDTIEVTFYQLNVTLPNDEVRCSDAGPYLITPVFTPQLPASVTRNFSYRWLQNGQLLNNNASTLTVSSVGTFQYTVEVLDNRTGCTSTDIQQVTINGAPTDFLGPDINSGCEGDTVTLNAGNSGLGMVNYSWYRNGVPLGVNSQFLPVTRSGQYVVDVSLNSCVRSFDVMVNFNRPPVPVILGDTVFCSERTKSVRLTGGTPSVGGPTFQWLDASNGSEISNTYEVTITRGGTYQLVMTSPQGCVARKVVNVIEECETRIRTGDAFSPNGDGKNDVFQFKGEDIRVFDVAIFNRWGQLIFQSTSQLNGWDGRTTSGKEAPAGTYVYVIRYKSNKGDSDRLFTQRGRVVLVK